MPKLLLVVSSLYKEDLPEERNDPHAGNGYGRCCGLVERPRERSGERPRIAALSSLRMPASLRYERLSPADLRAATVLVEASPSPVSMWLLFARARIVFLSPFYPCVLLW